MTLAQQELTAPLPPQMARNSWAHNRTPHSPQRCQAPVKPCAHILRSLLAAIVHRSGERYSLLCSFPFITTRRAPRSSHLPLLRDTEILEKGRISRFSLG